MTSGTLITSVELMLMTWNSPWLDLMLRKLQVMTANKELKELIDVVSTPKIFPGFWKRGTLILIKKESKSQEVIPDNHGPINLLSS